MINSNPSKLFFLLKDIFEEDKFLPVDRLGFDNYLLHFSCPCRKCFDAEHGIRVLDHFAIKEDIEDIRNSTNEEYSISSVELLNMLLNICRYYALCSLGATFNVMLGVTTILPNTIRFLNQKFLDICNIDHSTAKNLELTASLNPKNPKNSLLEAVDKTSTKMGKRYLRLSILQPSKGKPNSSGSVCSFLKI